MNMPDDNDPALKRAYQSLRVEGSQADKNALLRRLRVEAEKPVGFAAYRQRLAIYWERVWPQARLPTYGVSFALALTFLIALGTLLTPSMPMAPEIDDLDFEGGQAMVIENQNQPTTLIWLSEYSEEDEPAEADEEDAVEEESTTDEEDI